jgi:superoxide reductase
MVKELYEVYKCGKCGNMVEVVHAGGGELVCCGQPMKHLIENTTDAATEKHVPVIEQTAEGIRIRVGSAAHPMTDEHFIEWIQIILKDGRSLRLPKRFSKQLKEKLPPVNSVTFMVSGRHSYKTKDGLIIFRREDFHD